MKKLPVLWIVIAICLIAFVIFEFSGTKKKTGLTDVKNNQTETGTSLPQTNTSLYEAEQKKLQEKMDNYAVYNKAVDALDTSSCDKIVNNETLKMECLDNVYAAQASKGKDISFCEKIQDSQTKTRCTSSFAYDTAIAS